jgi:hypothetical protein
MKRKTRWLAAAAVGVVAATEARAYADPGGGMLLWQGLLAALFGAVFYGRKFLAWVGIKRTDKTDNGTNG